ncbi:MAG: rod shape-determining protein MreD [Elusimicrobia bacterium]|nr:rod shape-determining protein MreD [Elusimicrobiota bacterium]
MAIFLYYALVYIFACIWQFVLGQFMPFDVYPNFILVVIIYMGLTRGTMTAQTFGFILGITWDMFSTDVFGSRAFMFTIVGYFVGKFSKDLHASNIPAQMILTFCASVIVWLGLGLVYLASSPAESAAYFAMTRVDIYRIMVLVLVSPVFFASLKFLEGLIINGLAERR